MSDASQRGPIYAGGAFSNGGFGGLELLQFGQGFSDAPQPHAYLPAEGRSGCAAQTQRVSSHTKQATALSHDNGKCRFSAEKLYG
jgi:hypothetical protein